MPTDRGGVGPVRQGGVGDELELLVPPGLPEDQEDLADAVGQFRNGVEMGGVLGRELRQRRPVERRRSRSELLGPVRRGHANTVRGRSCTRGWSVSEGRWPSPPPGPEGPAVPGPIVARPVPPCDTAADAISCASDFSISLSSARTPASFLAAASSTNRPDPCAAPVVTGRTSRIAARYSASRIRGREMGGPVVGSSRQRGAPMNDQAGDIQASRIRIASTDEIAAALDSAGLRLDRAVIVLVGGAGTMGEKEFETVAQVLRDEVVPVAERRDAVVIDGGTDSGVMQLIGRARSALGGRFPLIGVAAEGTVLVPGAGTPSPDAVRLEPNHTLFLLVPGTQWGDEAAWMMEVAGVVAGRRSSVTVLMNGGQIAYTDVAASLGSGRPVVVLAGSGRTADAIAKARAGNGGDNRAVEIAASPLTTVADVGEAGMAAAAIEAALDGG